MLPLSGLPRRTVVTEEFPGRVETKSRGKPNSSNSGIRDQNVNACKRLDKRPSYLPQARRKTQGFRKEELHNLGVTKGKKKDFDKKGRNGRTMLLRRDPGNGGRLQKQ